MGQVFLENVDITHHLAQRLAAQAKKGDVYLLFGTLGAGKSTFARAFIQTLCGSTTDVPSPTFTLLQTYDAPSFQVYHYDLYRIEDTSELEALNMEEGFYTGVSLIEWPERLEGRVPEGAIPLIFTVNNDQRYLEFPDTRPLFA